MNGLFIVVFACVAACPNPAFVQNVNAAANVPVGAIGNEHVQVFTVNADGSIRGGTCSPDILLTFDQGSVDKSLAQGDATVFRVDRHLKVSRVTREATYHLEDHEATPPKPSDNSKSP